MSKGKSRDPARSEERYRSLYIATPALLHSIDEEGRLVEVSEQWLRVLGYERDEVLGRKVSSFLTEESRRHAENVAIPQLMKTGAVKDVSYRFRKKSGELIDILLSAVAERDAHGNLTHSLAALTDVTQQKKAEREVTRFRTMMDQAGDAIFLVSPETGRFVDCNATAVRRLQYSRDELLALEVKDIQVGLPLQPPREWSEFVAMIERSHGSLVVEGVHRRKDGTTFPVEISLTRQAFADEVYLVAMVRDTTERSQLEGQLRQAQKMEAIGRLTAGIAHNFNNMLMVILGNVEIDMTEVSRSVGKRLETVRSTAQRAADMVTQLLAYARQGAQVERAPVALADVLGQVADICRDTFDRRIVVETRVPGDLPPVLGNANQIQQVLMNLCLNARDAVDEADESVPRILIEAQLEADGGFVRTSVSDNGCGMDEKTLARVFDPFFTTKDVDKGTGLGLSTAAGAVRQHGGWIDCVSRPGQGARFSVFLPVSEKRDLPKEVPRERKRAPRGTESILIIEDESPLVALLTEKFEAQGFTVLSERDGLSGLESIEANAQNLDLVLLDLSLPRMSGEQILESIRTRFSNLKVIALTGGEKEAEDLDGVAELIRKPIELGRLVERVRSVLDS